MSNANQPSLDAGNFNASELEDIMAEIESLEKEFQPSPVEAAQEESVADENMTDEGSLESSSAESEVMSTSEDFDDLTIDETETNDSSTSVDEGDAEMMAIDGAALEEQLEKELHQVVENTTIGLQDQIDQEVGAALEGHFEGHSEEEKELDNVVPFKKERMSEVKESVSGAEQGSHISLSWPVDLSSSQGKFQLTLQGISITLSLNADNQLCLSTSEGLSVSLPLHGKGSELKKVA
jgi:hypothetical protein